MKITKPLILLCSTLLLSQTGAFAAAVNIQISKRLNREKQGCVDYLTATVKNALTALNAEGSPVFLGMFNEIEKLLRQAGVEQAKAKASVQALTEVLATAFNYPALQFSAGVFDDLVQSKKLLICAISENCSLAYRNQNFLLFTEQNEGIVLLRPPMTTTWEFAINFFGTLASSAGERILMNWLNAGHSQESRVAGSTDRYYKEFAAHYDGTLPLTPDSLNEGFAFTFITLYQTLVTSELYSIVRPDHANENAIHLAKMTHRDLLFGRNRGLTADIVKRLGLTEQNFFSQTVAILNTMTTTIQKNSSP